MAISASRSAWVEHRPQITRAAAVGLVAVAAGLAVPALAEAGVKVSAPRSVDAGDAYVVRYSATHVPRGARAYVTVRRETGKTTRVRRVRGGGGTLRVERSMIGQRTYGVETVRHGRVLARDRARVSVFGEVPFTTLFNSDTVTTSLPGGPFEFLPSSFHDGDDDDLGRYPKQINTITVTGPRNRCRSAQIRFAGFNQYEAQHSTTILTLTQPGQPIQRATAPYEKVGTLNATLIPGQPWVITGDATGQVGVEIEFNGTAICSSRRQAASAFQQPGS